MIFSNRFLFFSEPFWSVFVNSNKVFNFESANWTLFQIFTASDTSSIVFARHVNTVFVVFIANNASIRKGFLADISCFYSANISLAGTNFKNWFVLNLVQWTDFPFIGQSPPSSIRSSHVFNVILLTNRSDSCMNIGKMLIFRETEEICLFSTNRNFLIVWNLTG